jgi:hypothetical protein
MLGVDETAIVASSKLGMTAIVINGTGRVVVDFVHDEGHRCITARQPGA